MMDEEDIALLNEWERNKRKNPFVLVSPMTETRKRRLEAEENMKEARHILETAVENEKVAIELKREEASNRRAKSERIAKIAAEILKSNEEEEQKALEAEWQYHEDRVKKAVQMWLDQPEKFKNINVCATEYRLSWETVRKYV